MNRRGILAVVAVVAVLSAVLGWVAGQQIKSPGQIAAEQEPPEPSLITVPVERRTLSQNVIVRGTIRLTDETPLSVSSTVGSSVITRLAKEVGDAIDEGDVLIEVAGRPVIALQGQLPAFRNLIPGLDGPDVEQLEQSLSRLGYDPGPVDDRYTSETADAVASLYRDRGYPAPESDPGLQGAVDGAEAQVEGARAALASAQEALREADVPVTDLEKRQLDLIIDRAEADLDLARATATEAKAEAAKVVADAEAALAAIEDGGDEAAIAEATAALDSAEVAQSRTNTDQDLAVTSAELAVAEAEQARTDRLQPANLAPLRTQVSEAGQALADAQAELVQARAVVGAWIPTSEVVFLTSTPRQVASLVAEVGDIPGGSVMTISGAETTIDSGVSASDRPLLEEGLEALLEDDDLGLSIPARISFLAENPGGPGLSDDRYAMRLEAIDDIPDEAIGLNLRISIPITSSGGEVLAVPLAALSAGADGTARVEVEQPGGETELVEVSTGLRAGGFVEVEALAGASLEAGDRVVVGRDLQLPSQDDDADDEADEGDGDENG